MNTMDSTKPLVLFVGRKKQVIKQPWCLKWEIQSITYNDGGMDIPMPLAPSRLRLTIGEKLFSVTTIWPHKRYSRRAAHIIKTKRGHFELHLTKKFTELAN